MTGLDWLTLLSFPVAGLVGYGVGAVVGRHRSRVETTRRAIDREYRAPVDAISKLADIVIEEGMREVEREAERRRKALDAKEGE